MRPARLIASAWIAGSCACGDPLVGEDFLGTPTLVLGGRVQHAQGLEQAPPPERLRLSLFWIGFDSRDRQRTRVEQRAAVDSSFASFEMTVFETPPREALTFGGESGPAAGIALIVLYADNNDNEVLNNYSPMPELGPDTVLGASATHVVAYSAGAVDGGSEVGRILGAIGAGFHVFENESESTCTFYETTTSCAGESTLRAVSPPEASIVLTLYPHPSAVRVPAGGHYRPR